MQLYPCLGLTTLGLCAYNPAQPTPTYFTVGDAIAALGFMLAIQQLLKPICRFRLQAYSLRVLYLAWAVFLGALCSVVALLLPNLPMSHIGFFEYPLAWELFGGLLIGMAYAVVAMVSLTPARLYSFNLLPFVRAASAVLSAANDDDRVSLADDLLHGRNVERLTHAISIFLDLYPTHDSEPVGMNPLQQQLAIQLVEKLRHNMEGWYPTISRVLLAVIGPYGEPVKNARNTAHVILKKAVYKQIQTFPALRERYPDKIAHFLPPSVTYDPNTNALTHVYRGGDKVSTPLSALNIPEVDLTDPVYWQVPEPEPGPTIQPTRGP